MFTMSKNKLLKLSLVESDVGAGAIFVSEETLVGRACDDLTSPHSTDIESTSIGEL